MASTNYHQVPRKSHFGVWSIAGEMAHFPVADVTCQPTNRDVVFDRPQRGVALITGRALTNFCSSTVVPDSAVPWVLSVLLIPICASVMYSPTETKFLYPRALRLRP